MKENLLLFKVDSVGFTGGGIAYCMSLSRMHMSPVFAGGENLLFPVISETGIYSERTKSQKV